MKSLFKTVAIITFFSFLTRVTGFIFRIILSRIVGAEGLGLYQVATSVFMVLMTVIASGIPLIISRMNAGFIANKQNKKEGYLVSVALVYTLMLSIFLCLVVIIFQNLFSLLFTEQRCVEILLILLPSLIFSSVYSVFRGALWGKDNYFALCVSELYEQIVRIILGVLFIGSALSAIENAIGLAWSMSIACFLSMIFVLLLYFYYGGQIRKVKKEYFKPLIKQSTPITLMRVAGSFIQPLIAVIIPSRLMAIGYTSSQALSLYGVAVGMTLPLLYVPTTIIGSLSTALIPDISKAVAQNDDKHISSRISSSLFFAMFISSMFVPIFLAMGELSGMFLYDNILSGTLLQSSAWILLPLGLTNISSALLNSLGYESKSFINFVIGAIVMFISLWILPQFLGINALIWGFGINYTLTAILNIVLLKRKTNANLKILNNFIKLIIVIVPTSALTGFIVSLCDYVLPLFITLVVGGIVSLCSFILLSSVLNLVDIRAFMIRIKARLHFQKSKV